MLKFILQILILLVLTLNSYGQYVARQSNYLPTHILAQEELRPFFSDTTSQILFNPAKAEITDKEFIITDRIPFRIIGLKELKGKKLFYNFYHNSRFNDRTNVFINRYENLSTLRNYKSKNGGNFNQFYLAFIKKSTAIGLVGKLDLQKNSSDDLNEFDSSNISSFSNSETKTKRRIKNNNYLLGITFSNFHNDKELLAELSYEVFDFQKKQNEDSERFDFQNSDSLEILRNSQMNITSSMKNFRFNYSLYLKNRLNWFSKNDFGFISVKGFYQPKGKSKYDYSLIANLQEKIDEQIILDRNLEPKSSYKIESDIISGDLSFGYVWKKKFDELDILLSSIYQFEYFNNDLPLNFSQNTSTDFFSFRVEENEDTVLRNNLIFPIHYEYQPNNWFRLIGGYSFKFSHLFYLREILINSEEFDLINLETARSATLYKDKFYDIKTEQTIYLGMRLNHKSGLFIETSFSQNSNGAFDIFSLNRFLFIGYEFWKKENIKWL